MNASKSLTVFFVLAIIASVGLHADDTLVQRIQAVSEKSKSAKTASEFSGIVNECDALLNEKIDVVAHRKYVQTLIAWALDKRGATRVELAGQFRRASSADQANEILKQAMADFDRSITNDAKRWQTWMNRGSLRARSGDYPQAISDFGMVVKLNPKSHDALFNRGELNYQLENYEDALADYEAVLLADSTDHQAISGRGHCLLALNRYDEALACYSAVVEQLPDNAWALANRADAWSALHQWQSAHQDLKSAVALQGLPEIHRRLGWLLSTCPEDSICDGPAALTAAKKAVELGGESVINLDTLAAAYAANGQYDQARDLQTRVISMQETENPSAAVRQATYEKNERFQQAFDR